MKLTKTASGKQAIKISKKEWEDLGKKAGWMKEANGSWWGKFMLSTSPEEKAELVAAFNRQGAPEFIAEIKDVNPGQYPNITKFKDEILDMLYQYINENMPQ
jgi:hypothetical protein